MRTSLKTVFGQRQKRTNMKTMNSLLNSPWPSLCRQRVSALSFCVFAPAVVFPSNEQCLSLFIISSTFPPLFIPGSVPFSIPLHQLLKVRISPTHFHLFLYSHIFLSLSHLSLPRLGGHTAHLHYSAMLYQNSISPKFMNKPPTPVFVFFLPM